MTHRWLKRWLSRLEGLSSLRHAQVECDGVLDRSVALQDKRLIRRFVADPDNTFLVSFPRTGSHWLRMMLELYFERPLLTRSFYYHGNPNILALHTHDMDLSVCRRRVIYLYRDPVDTVYSQLRYQGEDASDAAAALRWAEAYGRHLQKWLLNERCTHEKTIVRYERLQSNLAGEFESICAHYGVSLDRSLLQDVAGQVDRDVVRKKTTHDPRVVDLSGDYRTQQARFREVLGRAVRAKVLEGRQGLSDWLEYGDN